MFTVIQDTREKAGIWDFTFAQECKEQIVATVKTGDYTLQGFETELFIERKRTTGELAVNLGSGWTTFKKELERARDYRYRYLICEFGINDLLSFPNGSSIPRIRWSTLKMSGKFMLKRLNDIKNEYDIEIVYCNGKHEAELTVLEIFKRVTEQN